jgi:predicted CoA-binding protein
MPIHDSDGIRKILQEARTIAVVGASPKPWRDSNSISHFLVGKGYTVYPVNPKYTEIEGAQCYPDVKSIPEKIDIVDVFRQSTAIPGVVTDAIAAGAKILWLQYGVIHEVAAAEAEQAGLKVVMDHCIAVDHRQLLPS